MPEHRDILCLSHLRWGFVYQRPNHLMARWAQDRRVFFVEEPVFDSAAPALRRELVGPRLHVVTPHLPAGTAPEQGEHLQRELIDELVREQGLELPILWFYTPLALGWA